MNPSTLRTISALAHENAYVATAKALPVWLWLGIKTFVFVFVAYQVWG